MPVTKFYTWVKSVAEEKIKELPTIKYKDEDKSPMFNIFWKDVDSKKALFYTRHSFISQKDSYHECFIFYFVESSRINVLCLNCGSAGVTQRIIPVVYEKSEDIIEVDYKMKYKQGSFNIHPGIYEPSIK